MATTSYIPGTRRESTTRIWSAALALTLLMHVVVIGSLWILRPFSPKPVEARPSDPIELIFEPAVNAENEDPSFFSELPEELADVAPEDPDFLSNIDSQARDEVAGDTENSLPRLDGSSEAPHVALIPGDPVPAQPSTKEQTSPQQEQDLEALGSETTPYQEPQPPVTDSKLLLSRPRGTDDILQDAMNNPEGGTPLTGGVTLNTVAWEYAPWLQKFRRDFLRDWRAPYAYRMGVIHGSHVLELEILPSGELARLEVKVQEGSADLVTTSTFTFETMAPFQPLPEGFPEESLILNIKLVYEQVLPRPSRRPVQQKRGSSRNRRRGGP